MYNDITYRLDQLEKKINVDMHVNIYLFEQKVQNRFDMNSNGISTISNSSVEKEKKPSLNSEQSNNILDFPSYIHTA